MAETAIATRPECPNGHGPMILRTQVSPEQEWCGVWYDCTPAPIGASCKSSCLFPSEALEASDE